MFVHCAEKIRDKCRCCICKEYLATTLEINFKLLLVVFSSNFLTLQQKPHDYICSGCKNMVSPKMYGFYWPTLYNMYKKALHFLL